MKTLLKNKKLISGLLALMLGVAILVMSLSLAWFVSEDDDVSGTITIGSLGIVVTLVDQLDASDPIDIYPETEYYFNQLAKVQKKGSIDAFVQINFQAIEAANGGIVPPVDFTVLEAGIPPIAGIPAPARAYPLGLWSDSNYITDYAWYAGADGRYYVEMMGSPGGAAFYANDELHFGYNIEFREPKISNLLNDLTEPYSFDVKVSAKAVQCFPMAARVDYFNSIRSSADPALVLDTVSYTVGGVTISYDDVLDPSGNPYFNALLDHVIVVDKANKTVYDAATGAYLPFYSIEPEGVWAPFSAGSGPDLVAIAKVVNNLPEGALKFALAAKYGIVIG